MIKIKKEVLKKMLDDLENSFEILEADGYKSEEQPMKQLVSVYDMLYNYELEMNDKGREEKDEENYLKKVFEKVMTFKEASEKYDVAVSTLRHRASDGRFEDGDIRKSGKTWLVTKSAMDRIYGDNNSA